MEIKKGIKILNWEMEIKKGSIITRPEKCKIGREKTGN